MAAPQQVERLRHKLRELEQRLEQLERSAKPAAGGTS
jgi:ubiquinone biosynthesis protein UbiJ